MRKLHPNLVTYLAEFNPAVETLIQNGFKATPTNAREGLANLTRQFVTDSPSVPLIQDEMIPAPEYQVPVRIYHPEPTKKLPILIYYHGGGHMAGSVSVYDPICRKLANITQHIVVSVDYRLAPECPYPAATIDAYWVIKNLYTVLDRLNILYVPSLSIAGDSGGGALVATVSHKAQFDASLNIKAQVLIYPSLDYTMDTPSMAENGTGFLLQKSKVAWYFDHYFSKGENRQQASPLYGDLTQKIPKTLIITAEFCPLRDEGVLYAQKLKDAGVVVEHHHFEDMIHTFMNMENLVPDACQKLYTTIHSFLQ